MINPISELFGRSPIKPIQQHMARSVSAAELLTSYFQAGREGDWNKAESIYKAIIQKEHEADELKVEIRLNLPKSLFLPVPRQDLLELLTVQDKVANSARDISGLMLGRRMVFPANMQEAVDDYVDAAVQTAHHALKAVDELDELLEFGFQGKELAIVEELVAELNAQEQKADIHERELRSALFAQETELPPVEVMFLYKLIEEIGKLADRAQRVGSRLLLLVAR
ncbi:TIGR00153 family protein [Agaribacterium haliotis]|uniref:TIGR00153 family protein n=1 Tax=Agaribacterium haliotis TaxID=2013869 RepID=UPI000BB58EBB|nr:TIGR00153 family protein [Agaribacterium haliotis]